jgi:hypothetical protein
LPVWVTDCILFHPLIPSALVIATTPRTSSAPATASAASTQWSFVLNLLPSCDLRWLRFLGGLGCQKIWDV